MANRSPDIINWSMDLTHTADIQSALAVFHRILERVNLDRKLRPQLTSALAVFAEYALDYRSPAKLEIQVGGMDKPGVLAIVKYLDSEDFPPGKELRISKAIKAAGCFDTVVVEQGEGGSVAHLIQPVPGLPAWQPLEDSLAQLRSRLGDEGLDDADWVRDELAKLQNALVDLSYDHFMVQQHNQQLNDELEETNRGVVALYGELDEQTEQLRNLNETLEQRVHQRTAEAEGRAQQLRALTSQLTQAEARERRRIAQTLHDHLQQLLVAAKMQLGAANSQVAIDRLTTLHEGVGQLIDEAIEVSRSLAVDLSPPVLFQAGLLAGLRWLAQQTEQKHGLSVDVKQTGIEPDLNDDQKQLVFRSVQELVFNVVKHAQASRAEVIVDTTVPRQLRVDVVDQGRGFDVAAFNKGDGEAAGFGVLSIQERLNWIGGKLLVESQPGAGTRMGLLLPLDGAAALGNAAEPSATSVKRGEQARGENTPSQGDADGPIRVLLVDDHTLMREGLCGILQSQSDIDVIAEAKSGREAVEKFDHFHPDIVLMDVNMPDIDGIEATRLIRERWVESVVVGLSMHDDVHVADAMRDAGASAYVTKVGASDQLCDVIRQLAGRDHALSDT